MKVAYPPAKPLLVYDGECRFCCLWVKRWERSLAGRVETARAQEVASRYPEIPEEAWDSSVQLILTHGEVLSEASAVYRALFIGREGHWADKLYRRSSTFASLSDWGYRCVASNRSFFSLLTRLLWGRSVEPATYVFSSWLLPRLFGLVALAAVFSLWSQAAGLFGPEGILPIEGVYERAAERLQQEDPSRVPFFEQPSLLWWSTDWDFIQGLFWAAVLAALGLMLGLFSPLCALLLWLIYLSLMQAGQRFLSFQWDILLVQSAFLLTAYCAWRPLDRLRSHRSPPWAGRFLIGLSLVALMLQSGLVKLASFGTKGENRWLDGTALDFHYWTQPIPGPTSWWIHQLPESFDRISLQAMLWIELWLLLLLFLPRRLRHLGVLAQVLLQLLIIASGNYGFFNWLTIVLCLAFVDDQLLPQRFRSWLAERDPKRLARRWPRWLQGGWAWLLCLWLVPILVFDTLASRVDTREPNAYRAYFREQDRSDFEKGWEDWYRTAKYKLRAVSEYGLFRVMTETRPEIRLWSRRTGEDWVPVRFRYKIDALDSLPPFFTPHMPRLDWQLWFAALEMERAGGVNRERWLNNFLQALAEGRKPVFELLEDAGFEPGSGPRQFRLELWQYEFTEAQEREQSGNYWKAEPVPGYRWILPPNR